MENFTVSIIFIHLEQKKKLNHAKKFSQERDHYHPVMPKDDINILNCYLSQN